MSYTYIKLKGGKEGKVWQTKNHSSYSSENCKWCGKDIKPGKAIFEADGHTWEKCCSMAHAKAYLNAKV
jgi:hypothetical protein